MRIAYLTSLYARGTDSFIRGEVLRLRELGFDIRTFSIRRPSAKEATDPSIQEEQANTHYLLDGWRLRFVRDAILMSIRHPIRFGTAMLLSLSTSTPGARGKILAVAYALEASALARAMQAVGISHLHNHIGQNSATVAMLTSLLLDIPYSLTIHGPLEFDRPQALAIGTKVSRSKFTIAISDYGRSQLMRWTPSDKWSKIKVVRCGVQPEFLSGSTEPPVASPRLLCVGRLAEQKGLPVLLLAAKRLREAGRSFELVIAGNGPLQQSLERDIAVFELQDCIQLCGLLSPAAVNAEIIRSRALVMPSFAEGLPVVIMESMARGRPVISTYIAGIPELVQPGITGWLVPAGSDGLLAEAMEAVLDAPQLTLAKMGDCGAAIVRREHDQRKQAAKLATLFDPTFSVTSNASQPVNSHDPNQQVQV